MGNLPLASPMPRSLVCVAKRWVSSSNHFQLLNTLTAIENVELPLLLAHNPKARQQAEERLRWVELQELAHRFPHQLSGGQQNSALPSLAPLCITRASSLPTNRPAISIQPPVISALDLLRRTASQFSVGVIMATHSSKARPSSTASSECVMAASKHERLSSLLASYPAPAPA